MTAVEPGRQAVGPRFTFADGFRLSLILEPDGTVRTVTELSGSGIPPKEMFLGCTIQEISSRQEGGLARARMWEQRLALARADVRTAHYADPAPGMPAEAEPVVDCTVTPLRTAAGTLDSIMLIVEDRATMRETERRLRESEQGFRMLAESLPQMVWSLGPDGHVDYFSPRWSEFTGRPNRELLGTGYMDLVHPDDVAVLAAARGNSEDQPTIFRLRRHDGVYRWMEAYLRRFLGADGNVVRTVGGTTDVTARRVAEDRAREHEQQLRGALSMTRLGRYTIDIRSRTVTGDARVSEIFGAGEGELVFGDRPGSDAFREGLFSIVHPDDAARVRQVFQSAIEGWPDLHTEYRILRPTADGHEERVVAAIGRVEFDANGPTRILGVIEDITERRREEESRLHVQKREAIGTLASGVAHDFNNVISAILSNASLAQSEIDAGASPTESVTEIARAAVRAAELVRRMLAYSREDGPGRAHVDLGAVVREVCALLRPTMPRGARLILSAEPDLPTVLADAGQMHQIVMNLVTNARQVIDPGHGEIEVSVDEAPARPGERRMLRLRVRDDGPGMSEAVQARAFEPFFTTKPADEGTGLGLSTVQTIVQDHGGIVELQSVCDEGTAFTILLPILEDEPLPDPAADAAGAPERPAARVLFVDDQPALVKLAERAMPAYGCETTGFTEPLVALDAFTLTPDAYDILVTDLSMPGLDGLGLAEQLRVIRPGLPIVLTSGYLSAAHRAQAERQGINAVMPKPSTIDDLATTILGLVDVPLS